MGGVVEYHSAWCCHSETKHLIAHMVDLTLLGQVIIPPPVASSGSGVYIYTYIHIYIHMAKVSLMKGNNVTGSKTHIGVIHT